MSKRNPIAYHMRTSGQYKKQVVRNKKAYSRKQKHRGDK